MKKTKILFVLLLALPIFTFGQMDCSKTLRDLTPTSPFEMSSLSKSAVCVTGVDYEFIVPLSQGHLYRFVFYASSVFNNDMHFTIINLSTNENVIDLPGKSYDNAKGTAVLAPYMDNNYNTIHPYFDIVPPTALSVKIVIKVKEQPEIKKGCVTVAILDREFTSGDFN